MEWIFKEQRATIRLPHSVTACGSSPAVRVPADVAGDPTGLARVIRVEGNRSRNSPRHSTDRGQIDEPTTGARVFSRMGNEPQLGSVGRE